MCLTSLLCPDVPAGPSPPVLAHPRLPKERKRTACDLTLAPCMLSLPAMKGCPAHDTGSGSGSTQGVQLLSRFLPLQAGR